MSKWICNACLLRQPREEKPVGGLDRPGRVCAECAVPCPRWNEAHLVSEESPPEPPGARPGKETK